MSTFRETSSIRQFVPVKDTEDYLDIEGMQPVDFSKLDKDDEGAIMLAVCVAMLWGWLSAKRDCPDCGGSMKLMDKPRYKDLLAWVCCNDGIPVHKLKHTKKK